MDARGAPAQPLGAGPEADAAPRALLEGAPRPLQDARRPGGRHRQKNGAARIGRLSPVGPMTIYRVYLFGGDGRVASVINVWRAS